MTREPNVRDAKSKKKVEDDIAEFKDVVQDADIVDVGKDPEYTPDSPRLQKQMEQAAMESNAMTQTIAPSEKEPQEYSYQERRTELRHLYEEGELDGMRELADRYDVGVATIQRDLQVIFHE